MAADFLTPSPRRSSHRCRWPGSSRPAICLYVGLLVLATPVSRAGDEVHGRAVIAPMVESLRYEYEAAAKELALWFLGMGGEIAPDSDGLLTRFRAAEERLWRARDGRRRLRAPQRDLDEAVFRYLLEAEALRTSVVEHRRERRAFEDSSSNRERLDALDRESAAGVREVERQLESMRELDRARPPGGASPRAAVAGFNLELESRQRTLRDRASALGRAEAELRSWVGERSSAIRGMDEEVRGALARFEALRAELDRREAELDRLVAEYNREARELNSRSGPGDTAAARARLAGSRVAIQARVGAREGTVTRLAALEAAFRERNEALRRAYEEFTEQRRGRERQLRDEARALERERAGLKRWSRAEKGRLRAAATGRIGEAAEAEAGAGRSVPRPESPELARQFGTAYGRLYEAAEYWRESADSTRLYRASDSGPRFDASAPGAAAIYAAVARAERSRRERAGALRELQRRRDRLDRAARAIEGAGEALGRRRREIEGLRREVGELRRANLERVEREAESRARSIRALTAEAKGRLGRLVRLFVARDRLLKLELSAIGSILVEAPERPRIVSMYRSERTQWEQRGPQELARLSAGPDHFPPPPGSLWQRLHRRDEGSARRPVPLPTRVSRGRARRATVVEGAEKAAILRRWFDAAVESGGWAPQREGLAGLIGGDASGARRFLRALFVGALGTGAVLAREESPGGGSGYRIVVSGRGLRIGSGGGLEPMLPHAD